MSQMQSSYLETRRMQSHKMYNMHPWVLLAMSRRLINSSWRIVWTLHAMQQHGRSWATNPDISCPTWRDGKRVKWSSEQTSLRQFRLLQSASKESLKVWRKSCNYKEEDHSDYWCESTLHGEGLLIHHWYDQTCDGVSLGSQLCICLQILLKRRE